jgi:hypothetical protein
LKEPLIRKYGEEFYEALDQMAQQMQQGDTSNHKNSEA